MDLLNNFVSDIRVAQGGDKVYKEECCFSFDNPENEGGLYVCMKSFLGFGRAHVENYSQNSGNKLFLHFKRIKTELPKADVASDKPTKLAIGIEGGFTGDSKKYDVEEHNSIVILPSFTSIPLPCADLPAGVQNSVASILGAESVTRLEELEAMAGMWDGEKRSVSKYANNLLQLANGIKVPPSGWKCEKCDKTDNLWLNLTDGSILCGRKFFDGSGGNNHAIDHYNDVHYPLAVKLGTITPNGADVFSYEEDDMVEDPNLAQHLTHFGINISLMEKTDKSMIELEIDMNQRIGEWATIQESGSQLVPAYGAGYTGMANLGNSCYMNSVMQVIFSLPDFKSRYVDDSTEFFDSVVRDPASDFNVQLAKLGCGLWSGNYSKPPPENTLVKDSDENQPGIKPTMFKSLIGRGHPEFSTKRQQDAQEYYLHFLNILERHNRGAFNPTDSLKFQVEERIECASSKKVKYTKRTEFLLPLQIKISSATNKAEVDAYEKLKKEKEAKKERVSPEEIVRAKIPFSSLTESFIATECISEFYSTAIKRKGQALKATRLASFPDFLMMQLKKFTVGEDWVPKKLDVSVEMPDEIDLKTFRGYGKQQQEEELPEETSQPEPEINMQTVSQLAEMGFPLNACKRAVHSTGNQGVEPAMAWVMDHMGDSDFAAEFVIDKKGSSQDNFQADSEAVAMIVSMGFTPEQAVKALKSTDNNVERAIDWIFSHSSELDTVDAMDTEDPNSTTQAQYRDGSEKYRLVAFISHMGTSTMVGHYVCHIFKDGKWVIFNDNKVAISASPPKDLGYLYLYKRI